MSDKPKVLLCGGTGYIGGLVIEGAVFRADLETLRKTNSNVDEPGILALYYLGWQHVPHGGSDYEIFSKVREWCEE